MSYVFLTADKLPFKRSHCRKCGCTCGYLARYIQINGRTALRWVCGQCLDYFTAGDLPFHVLRSHGVKLDQLPVCRDRSKEPRLRNACVACSADGEIRQAQAAHHWAPRSLFPDWGWELTVDLCDEHHDEWHQVMREHGLRYPHELAAI